MCIFKLSDTYPHSHSTYQSFSTSPGRGGGVEERHLSTNTSRKTKHDTKRGYTTAGETFQNTKNATIIDDDAAEAEKNKRKFDLSASLSLDQSDTDYDIMNVGGDLESTYYNQWAFSLDQGIICTCMGMEELEEQERGRRSWDGMRNYSVRCK